MIHDLLAACRDGIDLLIVYMRVQGYEVSEVSALLGMCENGVRKRLGKLQRYMQVVA